MDVELKSSAGFTLFELLIALALGALVAAGALGTASFSARVWELSTERAQRLTTRSAALDAVRRHWTAIEPIRIEIGDSGYVTAFSGDALHMQFFVRASGAAGSGVFGETLALAAQDHGSVLQVRRARQSLASSTGEWSWSESTVSLREETLAFRYFGRRVPGAAPEWREIWSASAEPPQLIGLFAVGSNGEAAIVLTAPRVRASQLTVPAARVEPLFSGVARDG